MINTIIATSVSGLWKRSTGQLILNLVLLNLGVLRSSTKFSIRNFLCIFLLFVQLLYPYDFSEISVALDARPLALRTVA